MFMFSVKHGGGRRGAGSLPGRGPGGLLVEARVHSRALHGGRALDGALVADLHRLAARFALETEFDGAPLHRPGQLHFPKNLAVERSCELFPQLLQDHGRASRTLARLHCHLPRTGAIGRNRKRHTNHQLAVQFEHGSSATTILESEAHVSQSSRRRRISHGSIAPGFARISASSSWNWASMTTRSMAAPSRSSPVSARFCSMRARTASASFNLSTALLIALASYPLRRHESPEVAGNWSL